MGQEGNGGKPNAQSQQAAIPLNPLLGFWVSKGPAALVSELKVGAERTVTPSCQSIQQVFSSRTEGFHMETSFEDSWVTCCFPPPSGKQLLITLGGIVRAKLSM